MNAFLYLICLFLYYVKQAGGNSEEAPKVVVYTVATEYNDGLKRYLRSAKTYGIDVEVLGLGKKWEGGDMNGPGGGQKLTWLQEKMDTLKKPKDKDLIILFTDSYDVMFLSKLDEIVNKFLDSNFRVLFSAEPFCWPDHKLAEKYPKNGEENPYLNSGGLIGYYDEIMEILEHSSFKNQDDDQLYYTKVYLDDKFRKVYRLGLDHKCTIFQNLNGNAADVELVENSNEEWPYIQNTATKERPLIVHGNGPSKLALNRFSNYLAKSWSAKHGCTLCDEKRIELKPNALPKVMVAVFIHQGTPFIEEFLKQIEDIDYPKDKIHLFISNSMDYHETVVEEFYKEYSKKYLSTKMIKSSDKISDAEARNHAKDRCVKSDCDYVFSLDSIARVKPSTLRYLLSTGYDVIAPLLVRPGQYWSNFWGAINSSGYYARSQDYMDIVTRKYLGIWNVPFISNCYVMNISPFRNTTVKDMSYVSKDKDMDPDMTFCAELRKRGVMMYVANEQELGHLVNPENFDPKRKNPDMYEIIDNPLEWEERYIHQEYRDIFAEDREHAMPCPDVYWFPIVTPRFCTEWIEIMEAYGKWSDGSNMDKRLEGGYEAVPTRDIHMKQVGLDSQWLYFLKEYVRPVQEKVFLGYYHNPPVSLMNFVVRYRPDEQPSLRPHHDSSTYTINIALNTPHVDFEGGGCRFVRYNCSVRDTKLGWMLMHPGRLTHFHEGLPVTNGTRYIMISFIDP